MRFQRDGNPYQNTRKKQQVPRLMAASLRKQNANDFTSIYIKRVRRTREHEHRRDPGCAHGTPRGRGTP